MRVREADKTKAILQPGMACFGLTCLVFFGVGMLVRVSFHPPLSLAGAELGSVV